MWPNKVIVRIEGGLGNQLFQYAAARSLADRIGSELALDIRGLSVNEGRKFQLDLYQIRAEIANEGELSLLPDPRKSRVGRLQSYLSHRLPLIFSHPVFWPRDFSFDENFYKIESPVYMVGYWQSEKYFVWNKNNLKKDFRLKSLNPIIIPIANEIQKVNSISLHVRRGDYLSNESANKIHGLCSLYYYEKAIHEIRKRVAEPKLFIFSDDLAWARENIKTDIPISFVDVATIENGYLDLELMRLCKHHIIANSSFSWWGAWLGESKGQTVYAPSAWFADSETNSVDIVPAHWIRL
jgi:Glycosyl transferase family 11